MKKGNLRYLDKEKSLSWSQSRGLKLPKLADTIKCSNNIILQKDDIVKNFAKNKSNNDILFSERDSEGNKLTKEQMDFFKDSKVRDENGNLLKVYHGTRKGDFSILLFICH